MIQRKKRSWSVALVFGTLLVTQTLSAQLDTLPFRISEEKKLSDEKLARKKEGFYITGLPRFAYDPIQGFGIGFDGELFNNGKRDDPFFAYTPYRQRYKMSLWVAQNGKIGANLHADLPYFLNTKWRLRGKFAFADNPNKLYFGVGEAQLNELDPAFYSDYDRMLRQALPGDPLAGENPEALYTDARYHYLAYRKYALDLVLERSFFDGRLRVLGAAGFTLLNYRHYDGERTSRALDDDGNSVDAINRETRITHDHLYAETGAEDSYWNRYNITGYRGGFSSKVKAGVIYDTRNYEPDPHKGTLLEYGFGATDPIIGSDFSYTRHMVQWMQFIPLFTYRKKQSTLALRSAFSAIAGNEVFFREIFDVWSASQGRIGLLGGEDNLRGYKKFRFGAPLYGFGSVEWRTQLAGFELFDQDWVISAVPFFDYGRTWDEFSSLKLANFKYNYGLGARIHWNQSTIIRLDYAISAEDRQFFLVFGQMF